MTADYDRHAVVELGCPLAKGQWGAVDADSRLAGAGDAWSGECANPPIVFRLDEARIPPRELGNSLPDFRRNRVAVEADDCQ